MKPNGRSKSQEHWLNIGPAHTYDLEEARDLARQMRKRLREGEDLASARAAERASRAQPAAVHHKAGLTFRQAAEAFFTSKSPQWRNKKHREQFTASFEAYVYRLIGDRPVVKIDTPMVLSVLNQEVPMAKGEMKRFWLARPETASRVRRRLEWVLAWATVSEYRTGENPARWRGHLDHVLPARGDVAKTRSHPALPFARASEFIASLRTRDNVSARALEFCILDLPLIFHPARTRVSALVVTPSGVV